MRRVLLVSGILAALVALPLPAHAAKGIVKGGGSSGSILVTETSGFITEIGDEIEYRFEIPEPPYLPRVSDAVTYDIVPDPLRPGAEMAINIVREIEGTLITTPQSNGITVSSGQSVLIRGAQIGGKISVSGGGSIVIDSGTSIDGKIECNNGTVAVLGSSSVGGKIETQSNSLLIGRNSVLGPVQSEGDRYVTIRNCTIGGKLELKSSPANGCSIGNNTVDGKIDVPATCGP